MFATRRRTRFPGYGPVWVADPVRSGWTGCSSRRAADRSFETRVRKLARTAVLLVDGFAVRELTTTRAGDL